MIARLLIALTRFLVGGHARWQGCAPAPRQRIYFANHASHLDTLILWAALPARLRRTTHPVAARDYWGAGPIRRFIAVRVLGAVLVDRQGGRGALAPMCEALARGHSLILFPEGTRGSGALPGPFRAGLHHLARACPDAELVPAYLANLARAYPRGAILPAPLHCVVSFGAPLVERSGECRGEFLERARGAVCALAEGEGR